MCGPGAPGRDTGQILLVPSGSNAHEWIIKNSKVNEGDYCFTGKHKISESSESLIVFAHFLELLLKKY